MKKIFCLFLLAVSCRAGLGAIFPDIPPFLSNAEGNTATSYPFNLGVNVGNRFQQVYNAPMFSPLIPTGGWIDMIVFRVDGPTGHSFDNFGNLPTVQVSLSTTARAADGLSSTFALNVGSDNTVVFPSAPLRLSGAWRGPNVVSGFGVEIFFPNPFFYNPAAGNLLIDIQNFSGGVTSPLDAHDDSRDGISSVFSGGGTTGTTSSLGLPTSFRIQTVPEPSTWALLGLGTCFLGFTLRRRPQHGGRPCR